MSTGFYWLYKHPTCTIREAIKTDIAGLLERFSRYGGNISFSSFKILWNEMNFNIVLRSFPSKMNHKLCFHLVTEVALELLFFNNTLVDSSSNISLENNRETHIAKHSVWNIGVIYFLYCYIMQHSKLKPEFVPLQIRLSLKYYQEIEYCIERWKLIESGHQAIRLWTLMLSQNMFVFSSYPNGISLNQISVYVQNVVENKTRVSLNDIILDNQFVYSMFSNQDCLLNSVDDYLPYHHSVDISHSNILNTEVAKLYTYKDNWCIDQRVKLLNLQHSTSFGDSLSHIHQEALQFLEENDHNNSNQTHISSLDDLMSGNIAENSSNFDVARANESLKISDECANDSMDFNFSFLLDLERKLCQFNNDDGDENAINVRTPRVVKRASRKVPSVKTNTRNSRRKTDSAKSTKPGNRSFTINGNDKRVVGASKNSFADVEALERMIDQVNNRN